MAFSWDDVAAIVGGKQKALRVVVVGPGVALAGTGPMVSLKDASEPGPGAAFLFDGALSRHAMQVRGAGRVAFMGTIDGEGWFPLDTTENPVLTVVDRPLLGVRADLVSGGPVTATLVSTL